MGMWKVQECTSFPYTMLSRTTFCLRIYLAQGTFIAATAAASADILPRPLVKLRQSLPSSMPLVPLMPLCQMTVTCSCLVRHVLFGGKSIYWFSMLAKLMDNSSLRHERYEVVDVFTEDALKYGAHLSRGGLLLIVLMSRGDRSVRCWCPDHYSLTQL